MEKRRCRQYESIGRHANNELREEEEKREEKKEEKKREGDCLSIQCLFLMYRMEIERKTSTLLSSAS